MADEEGVVAIVQGLKDAGLAVTVLNRRLLRSRYRNENSYRRPLASKSSVETNTNKSFSDYYTKSKGISVGEGHYASSYQIDHCNARTTSPPQNPPGFPPQRFKPSRTEGNFEVGGNYGVWDAMTSHPRGYRGGVGYSERSIDSGSMYANRCERLAHETFAHSLRRYPACSLERSVSSELVQKLLTYTQNKYLTKSTSKSQRSLNRHKSPQSSKFDVKPSKNIQTYTRTKCEVHTKDCGANTCHDLNFTTKKRRSYSTFNDNGYKYENDNTSYDYLESPTFSRHSARMASEVRYMRDVKRYIHDTIRQIYDDKPLVCPKIRSRYSHHRRQHHKGQHDQTPSQSIEVQASLPTTSRIFNHCGPTPGSHSCLPNYASATTSNIICCNCNKPRPCVCEQKAAKAAAAVQQHISDWLDELPIFSENTRENKREKEQIVKELEDLISKVPKDENYDENVKETIESYIENLPMWDAIDNEDEDGYKKQVVDGLMDRLQTVEDKTVAAVKDVVRKWLDYIQFDRNIDLDKSVNAFAAHLTPLLNDISELKTKLIELLESLPITNKEDVIKDIRNNLLNDLTELSTRSGTPVLTEEELENEMNEFLQDHPVILNQPDKVKNLARKLKNTQSKPISEREKEKKMKDNVSDWIDTLPKSTRETFTPKEKEEFSNDLVDKVQDATNLKAIANDKKSSLKTQNEIENEIWGLLESMDVDQNDVDEPIVKKYALNLKELKKSDFDEEDVANKTIDFLNELGKSGIPIRGRDQDKFQEKVLSKLKTIQAKDRQSGSGKRSSFVTSTPKKGRAPSGRDFNVSSIGEGDESSYSIAGPSGLKTAEKRYNNELNDQIESWVESLPINLDREKKLKKAMINDLANDIMDRQKYLQIHPNAAKSDAEELEHLKYQVFRWLNKMDEVKDHEIASVMEKTKNLMDEIKNVDVPRFDKSSLRSPSKGKRFGPSTKEKSFRSPTTEQNFGSSNERQSLGSPNKEKGFGSPTREHSIGSPTKEKRFGSPTREQSIGNKTYIPTQNPSMFIKENLDGAITDWIKQLPLYETASPEQKRKFEKVAQETSKAIKRVYDGIDNLEQDTDKLVKDEIKKQMKNFPISSGDKNDKKFMAQAAEQLLQYLKDQQMFQDISERTDVPYDEYLKKYVDDWANSLSLTHLNSSEKIEFEALKDEFTSKLKQAREDRVDEDTLKAEINKYIKEFPLKNTVRRNKEYQDKKEEELLKGLSTLPAPMASRTKKGTPTSYGVGSSKGYSKVYEPVTTKELKAVGDNLGGAIFDWIKQQPDYADKKGELDKIVPELSKNIKSILKHPKGEDRDKLLIDEMTKQLKKSPLDSSKDAVDATQLVQYLKDIQMLQEPSGTMQTSPEDLEKIVDSFANNKLDLKKGTWADKKKFAKLKSDLVTKLKEMIDNKADPEELKKEIKNSLSRFPLSEEERRDDRFLEKVAEELIDSLPTENNNSPDVYSYVRKGFANWMKNLPLDKGKNIYDIPKEAIDQITRRLSEQMIHTDVVSIGETRRIIEEETNKFLQKIPLDRNKSHDPKELAKDLFDCIKGHSRNKGEASSKDIANETSVPKSSSKDKTTKVSISTSTETLLSNKSGSMHPSIKSAADQLADSVEQWVNNLPIKEDTLEEKSKASNLRRYLSSRIISKVSELNTNPEIFNDDFLYEEMFEDDVDNMITALSSEDLRNKMPSHKKTLIDIVKDARLKAQAEMAGTVYRQLLREVVSKNVPSDTLSENENASFEVLKEDVADAFVSLHYIRGLRGDTESNTQFKNNVKGEIDVFCADYLKSHPKTPINTEKLNNDLYKALKDVPAPKDETMRNEIEIIKIKEVINQWIHEGKLFGKQTGVDRLKTKKKISVLAKKIHDIEKLKESNPDFDSDDMLKKEIKKWLQKMPLVVKDDLEKLAEQLIKKLKETEEWRKSLESDSSGKESILPASSYSDRTGSSPLDSSSFPDGSSRLPASSYSTGTHSLPRGSSRARFCCSPKPAISSIKVLRRSMSPSRTCCKCPEGPLTPVCKPATAGVSTVPEVPEPTTTETSTAPEFTIVPSPCAPPCAIPPSTLSPEDREYLRKIRERVTQSMTQSPPKSSKDAAVSPIPVDYGSQTEITVDITTTTPQAQSSPRQAQTSCCQTSEPVETCKPRMQAAGSQVEVVPHVIVKEYYWDSVDSKMSPCSKIITCSPTPCQPCSETPEATSSPRPCPARTSQHAQTTPAPCTEECDLDYQEYPYFLPDLPPCTSRLKSCHNVGSKIKGSNRNLAWSKEEFYGERRDPSDEEEIIIDTGRRKKLNCRCKDRVTLTSHCMKKRECKSCRPSNDDTLKRCPKCCGVHCPFPSYLYFK